MRQAGSRYVILGVLDQAGPLSGYEVRRWLSATVGPLWSESYGQLYPQLETLSAEGLIVRARERQRSPRDRKRYRITAAGRRILRAWVTLPARPETARMEVLVKVLFAKGSGMETLRGLLDAVRTAQEAELGKMARTRASLNARSASRRSGDKDEHRAVLMVLDYRERLAAMRLTWAEDALRTLDGL
jgi:DNA-binding PadR family transcriptional regulator